MTATTIMAAQTRRGSVGGPEGPRARAVNPAPTPLPPDPLDVALRHSDPQRQADQASGYVFRVDQPAMRAAEPEPRRRAVQRHVVEVRLDADRPQ